MFCNSQYANNVPTVTLTQLNDINAAAFKALFSPVVSVTAAAVAIHIHHATKIRQVFQTKLRSLKPQDIRADTFAKTVIVMTSAKVAAKIDNSARPLPTIYVRAHPAKRIDIAINKSFMLNLIITEAYLRGLLEIMALYGTNSFTL